MAPCRQIRRLLLAVAMLAAPCPAQEVAAVLSSGLGPYTEALAGFQQALGEDRPVAVRRLDRGETGLPRGARVVVTFGSKASLREYPDRLRIVQCMSPAAPVAGQVHESRFSVHMMPHASHLLDVVRRLQPGARRLVVLSIADLPDGYMEALQRTGASVDVQVRPVRLASTDDLPAKLRGLPGKGLDALWLAPDPQLINGHTFAILKEFARANRVPFYVPTSGFVDAGAMASVAPSFRQIGAEAAVAALRLLAGLSVSRDLYPAHTETTLSPEAARRSGLREEDFAWVDRLVPSADGAR